MRHEVKSLLQVNTRKLIWLIGITFAVIITFQYLELPYGNVFSSLFPSGKVSVEEQSRFLDIGPSSAESSLNFNDTNASNETAHDAEKEGNITSLNNQNKTGAVNETAKANDVGASEDGFTSAEVGLNRSSTLVKDSISSREESEDLNKTSTVNFPVSSNNSSIAENVGKTDESFSSKNGTVEISTSNNDIGNESVGLSPINTLSSDTGLVTANTALGKDVETNVSTPIASSNSSISTVEQHATPSVVKNEKLKEMQNNFTKSSDDPAPLKAPKMKEKPQTLPALTTIADMNNLVYQSRVSYKSKTPRWPSEADKVLLEARLQIESTPIIKNDPQLYAPLYRNVSMFKRSYELMENILKVYVYKEGKRPIAHTWPLKGIYASEGWFMKQLETSTKFVTKNPRYAHMFYLPFSSRMLEETLYVVGSHSHKPLIQYLKNYVNTIAAKYPYWNRTEGADHFLVACHDWAPSETREPMANCIKALCNSDVREGYVFGKDVSLPETYVGNPKKPLRDLGGYPPSKRSILAFFAGSMHGYLRPILLEHWGNKDPDMKIFGRMPNMPNVKGKLNYIRHMKTSKYCLCPRGYEVNSPRVVEAIFYECVPVIISDNFVPPFFEVLNWESFAVFVLEKDIPNLKKILLSIPEKQYLQMQLRVKKIQQHFLWHPKPEKYDIFHMILHSVWYNRVFQMKSR
ncbi:Exostosin family protein, putative isoform 2 [Hibiscus syriacus]|uniref:Exostosin family protein, putative isoform 2 n=1 Tax=Hibiscus syriacus TaxID=106335 RepID=A0A6A2YCP4_HIBSY|nr:probable glycosyltransferase At5g03795 [Hibiscus syriacus]KAE8676106.1 Exostosin family protein, putative isoform 2 [Hibiscus syriacus]